MKYARVASLKTPEAFAEYLSQLGIDLGFDRELEPAPDSPLAQPLGHNGRAIGNRFCILPMEGWDGTHDGKPTDLTFRRWRNFGLSGAKLIWGGEAVAVRFDGRANPNQLQIGRPQMKEIEELRLSLVKAHEQAFGSADDLYVGLQLTHSGRFCKPRDKKRMEPRTLYRHPLLDEKFAVPDGSVMTDAEIYDLTRDFVRAGKLAHELGFDFVDIKHCHGYLGHEFLSAVDRPGRYGGSLENRTRFLRDVIDGLRSEARGLDIGVRVSLFDMPPWKPGPDGAGVPSDYPIPYHFAFGADPDDPLQMDLSEPFELLRMLEELGVRLICLTAGSPYYNPHIQRPALFPPSDGYQPPEDPLVGVARQIRSVAEVKKQFPNLIVIGSGYSYLQDWLPHVAQHQVRLGATDFVGLGRMVLSYPELPADLLAGRPLQTKRICRTFSDCTTGPRNGLVSGCYPLDPFYKEHADHQVLRVVKKQARS